MEGKSFSIPTLIEHGAKLNLSTIEDLIGSTTGFQPLETARIYQDIRALKFLFKGGAVVSHREREAESSISKIIRCKKSEQIFLLLKLAFHLQTKTGDSKIIPKIIQSRGKLEMRIGFFNKNIDTDLTNCALLLRELLEDKPIDIVQLEQKLLTRGLTSTTSENSSSDMFLKESRQAFR